MIEFIRQHKIVAMIVVLNILAILIAVLVVVMHKATNASVDIYVLPSEATIELNGKRFDNFSSYNLMPGEYRVKISMDGMQTREYDLTLEDNGFERVWNYLLSDNGSFDYYISHPDEAPLLTKFRSDENVKKFMEYHDKVVSIRDALPLEYYERSDPNNQMGVFIEEDGEECSGVLLCLVVYGGEQHKNIALDLIKNAGYNPDDYRIRFEEG